MGKKATWKLKGLVERLSNSYVFNEAAVCATKAQPLSLFLHISNKVCRSAVVINSRLKTVGGEGQDHPAVSVYCLQSSSASQGELRETESSIVVLRVDPSGHSQCMLVRASTVGPGFVIQLLLQVP